RRHRRRAVEPVPWPGVERGGRAARRGRVAAARDRDRAAGARRGASMRRGDRHVHRGGAHGFAPRAADAGAGRHGHLGDRRPHERAPRAGVHGGGAPRHGVIRELVRHPVVQAPMGGGPSTPALAAAVSDAGGLGFLAAGYKTAVARYLDELRPEAAALDVELGAPAWTDDDWDAKLDALVRDPVAVVSFAFGCPSRDVVAELRRAGSRVIVTITEPDEATTAAAAGADAVCVQGIEAGAHRGGFTDDSAHDGYGVLALLGATRAVTDLPVVAAGGIMDGRNLAAVLAAGA